MLSAALIAAVRLSGQRNYKLAQQADIHPSLLSQWLNKITAPRTGDRRVIVLGAIVGVSPEDCFEPDVAPTDRKAATAQAGAR